MSVKIGTLKDLNVNPGDVVQYTQFGEGLHRIFHSYGRDYAIDDEGNKMAHESPYWRIITRSVDTPKLWCDMTPEEKGALLLARHEGKVIEYLRYDGVWCNSSLGFLDGNIFRIKPEPKIETVTAFYRAREDGNNVVDMWNNNGQKDTVFAKITFNLIDGKPDCASIKMEELK